MLRQALIDLIPEQGFDLITVKEITERAGLNRATFYLHYRNKEALLNQGIREILGELTAKQPVPDGSGEQFSFDETRQTITMYFEHIKQYANFYKVMLGDKGVWHFIQELQDYIFDETKERLQRYHGDRALPTADTDLVVRQLSAGYIGVIRWWLANDMPLPPEEIADKLVAIFRDGIYRSLGYQVEHDSFRIGTSERT